MPKQKSKPRQRDFVIDTLRAVSIIVMILMHISPYFPKLTFASLLWRWGQWVVPAFILCSLSIDKAKITNAKEYVKYLKKRALRLLPPYYLWFFAYLALMVVIGHRQISASYVTHNLVLIGGSDFNWLVLLFIYVTLALPFLRKIVDKSEVHSLMTFFLCVLPSALFFGNRSFWSSGYRFWMLLPWMGVTLGILLILKWWEKKDWQRVGIFTMTNVAIFLYWYTFFQRYQITTNTFHHKYPPDMYYVSFSVWSVVLAYLAATYAVKYLKRLSLFAQILTYISSKSYQIFFVHILVLYVLDVGFPKRPFDYPMFTLLVFIPTFLVIWILEYVNTAIRGLWQRTVDQRAV